MSSSVESALRFISYKIENLKLEMKPHINLVGLQGQIDPSLWDLKFELRVPTFIKNKKQYIGGFKFQMFLYPKEFLSPQRIPSEALISLEATIVGLFSIDEGRLPAEAEKKLVKVNIPMILMPYLRATVTSLFATAGFGSVLIPLINIAELSQKILQDVEIQEIEG